MMRHIFSEGWLLLRARYGVSLALALTLAVPLCLAGVLVVVGAWIQPFTQLAEERLTVAVLLHPRLGDDARRDWIRKQSARHGEWELELVPPAELGQRLGSWFPYLDDFLKKGGDALLPSLVEVRTAEPASLDQLVRDPAVTAIGPRSSVHRLIATVAERLGVLLGLLCGILLLAAAALAAIWVHLEIYRHADELTVLRLIGAAEAAIRGPFLVAVAVPGLVAALVAAGGTVVVVRFLSDIVTAIGLPPVGLPVGVLLGQFVLGLLLPLGAGALTLIRHAFLER